MNEKKGMFVHPVALMLMAIVISVSITLTVIQQSSVNAGADSPGAVGSKQATAQAGTSGGLQLYYSPMHPWIVQDHPGTCPICGMDLVEMPLEDQAVYVANHPEFA